MRGKSLEIRSPKTDPIEKSTTQICPKCETKKGTEGKILETEKEICELLLSLEGLFPSHAVAHVPTP